MLAKESGLEVETVRNIVKQLARYGEAASTHHEVEYTLTSKGEAKASKAASRTEQELQELRDKAQYQRVRRAGKNCGLTTPVSSVFNWRGA